TPRQLLTPDSGRHSLPHYLRIALSGKRNSPPRPRTDAAPVAACCRARRPPRPPCAPPWPYRRRDPDRPTFTGARPSTKERSDDELEPLPHSPSRQTPPPSTPPPVLSACRG